MPLIISPLIYFTTGLIKKKASALRYIRGRIRASGRGGGGDEKVKRFLADPRTRVEQRAPRRPLARPAAQSLLHNASPS